MASSSSAPGACSEVLSKLWPESNFDNYTRTGLELGLMGLCSWPAHRLFMVASEMIQIPLPPTWSPCHIFPSPNLPFIWSLKFLLVLKYAKHVAASGPLHWLHPFSRTPPLGYLHSECPLSIRSQLKGHLYPPPTFVSYFHALPLYRNSLSHFPVGFPFTAYSSLSETFLFIYFFICCLSLQSGYKLHENMDLIQGLEQFLTIDKCSKNIC